MKKVNILVVDDRPEGVLAVQAVLERPDYNLVPAASGMEALKSLLEMDFAVILMDVQMPVMNGFETAEVIKTREKSRHIPIIFMSAINQDEQYVYKGYESGAVDYLLKPFDPHILRSKVSIFVEMYKKNQLIKEQSELLHENEIKAYAQALDRLEIESLRRYKYLADSISQILFRFRPDGSSVYLNRSWFEYTGLAPDSEFNNRDWEQVIHPYDLQNFDDFFKGVSNEDVAEFECRILNSEGKFRWHLVRIAEEDGFLLGTATDIEDRKKSEDAQRFLSKAGELLVSSLDLQTSLEHILDLVVPQKADWCSITILQDSTPKLVALRIFDQTKDPSLRRLHEGYFESGNLDVGIFRVLQEGRTQSYRAQGQGAVESTLFGGEPLSIDIDFSGRSATIVPMVLKGRVVGAMTFSINDSSKSFDASEVSIFEELARRTALAYENSHLYQLSQTAIQIRNDFLSIASHELNTPITSLKLQLQMIKRKINQGVGNYNAELFVKSIDSSVKHVDRLIKLVGVLLDVSRIHSGKFTYSFEEFSLKAVLNEILERNQDILSDANCEVQLSELKDLHVTWDRTRFEQVITNLLNNAIKYAPGVLDISVLDRGASVQISIADHGPGIQKEKLGFIFERFERLNSNQNVGGLGLGLYIVKQIVEGHGGSISVESEIGHGTTFTLVIPQQAEPLALESHQSSAPA